ncbi:MAG: hypothetical protein ACT4R6_00245 [Gemmatimonadaceae bacterium]
MARFIPPDHSKGDANTLGGYMLVHGRPPAFEGSDGMSYSVSIEAAATHEPERPWGAFLLFMRWRRVGPQGVEGHLETDYLAYERTPQDARQALGEMSLGMVRSELERLLTLRSQPDRPARKWWDAMRDEG